MVSNEVEVALINSESDIKQRVREFYDSVGWKQIGDDIYQNARYEDLRPVSREYIHRCHLRVTRHLNREGEYLLDAGSGPIQYPEYLEYSSGFRYRVCLDISILALKEARERIGSHGLFVVGDVANLPFKRNAFDGVVSLHTIHHLPAEEQRQAFDELHHVLIAGSRGVVIYSWGDHALLVRLTRLPIRFAFSLLRLYQRLRQKEDEYSQPSSADEADEVAQMVQPTGTFTYKHDYDWVKRELYDLPGMQVVVWRSVSTAFLRAFIHRPFFGKWWLRALFFAEARAPHLLGRIGQYPMILFEKQVKVKDM